MLRLLEFVTRFGFRMLLDIDAEVCCLFKQRFRDESLPRGLRSASIDCSHCSGFTAFLKNSAASFQLAPYFPASTVASHFSAAETAAVSFPASLAMTVPPDRINPAIIKHTIL
jgi:hypothetical protein